MLNLGFFEVFSKRLTVLLCNSYRILKIHNYCAESADDTITMSKTSMGIRELSRPNLRWH